MDEVVHPNFKQHNFPAGGRKFSSTNQPAPGRAAEAARAKASVKEALLNAFDKLGNEAFFIGLGRGSPEDKRCLAMILAKLLPIEVAGSLDTTLTVRVVTQLGAGEEFPTDAATTPRLPAPAGGRAPEDGSA